jgi:hypothetical protein
MGIYHSSGAADEFDPQPSYWYPLHGLKQIALRINVRIAHLKIHPSPSNRVVTPMNKSEKYTMLGYRQDLI